MKAGFIELYEQFSRNHPDWQINLEFFTTDIGGEHARMLEQARAGRAPDCAAVDSFQGCGTANGATSSGTKATTR
jgi:multiple sugar transport system substrate-binding protein